MSMDVEWMQDGLCREVSGDIWFPESVGVAGQRQAEDAMRICMSCPVVVQCRAYGKRFSRGWGVWGGVNRGARNRSILPTEAAEISHGTEAGAAAHRRRREPVCLECRKGASLANALRKDRRRSA